VTLRELLKKYPDGKPPQLDPIIDMQLTGKEVTDACAAIASAKEALDKHPAFKDSVKNADITVLFHRKADLLKEAEDLKRQMQESQLQR
jgi:hypothetical protein